MKKMTIISAGLLIFVFGYFLYVSNKALIEPITAVGFEKYSICRQDSDCVLTESPGCGSCGCGVYTNKSYLEEYKEKVKERCKDYRGPVCGLSACPRTDPKCKNGKCVGVAQNYNIINQFVYRVP